MTDDRTVCFSVKQLTSRPQQHNAKSTKPCTYTRIKHHWKVLRRIQVRWQEWAADSFSWFVSIYHLLIGVNTERKRRSESAAKDRQSGSSCHGHCKCPFTEHLTQDCSQQVGVSPRPRGHSQPSSFVIPLSFYLSVSQPRTQIFAWSSVTSSAFLSTRLRPVKDPHEEEREGRGAPIGPQLTWVSMSSDLTPIWRGIKSSSGNCQQSPCLITCFSDPQKFFDKNKLLKNVKVGSWVAVWVWRYICVWVCLYLYSYICLLFVSPSPSL